MVDGQFLKLADKELFSTDTPTSARELDLRSASEAR